MASKDLHNSVQNIISDDKPTVRKSLVIGVGGSGMKGVLAVKKWVEANLPAEAFRYLRWIGIDTTDIETSIEGKGGRYRFPSDQFFQEERRMLYIASPTPSELSLEFLREKYKNDPVFSWLPNPDVYDISTRAGQGANQTRPLGRLAFYFNEEKIRQALIQERDRLEQVPNNPKYFQLLDVQKGTGKVEEDITFTIKSGQNKYYFKDKITPGHTITSLSPHRKIRAILSPHTDKELGLENFPKDEKGYYFEINSKNFEGRNFSFRVKHQKIGAQFSIFITCSIVGGTGNGMILDLVAMVKDIFKDYWPVPRIYGILVLPSAFKRVVYNRNARANAYAALKEIDYFMSGNDFKATYPSGHSVHIPDRVFNEGMLYLLDVENMAGNSLQGRDQVQELTGQFIATFIGSQVGGAIEERMVNDSTRASIYLPKNSKSQRKAIYNSFGISRVLYPVPHLKELGYKIIAERISRSFFKDVDPKLLLETMGDINRGLVRALGLNCRLIFERMYPDYSMDIEVEFRSLYKKFDSVAAKNDVRAIASLLERAIRDYNKDEQEKIKSNLMLRMERRYRLELEKIKTILEREIHKYIQDPQKGFMFAEEIVNLLLEKLELYQKRYYEKRVGLARYSTEQQENIIFQIEQQGLKDIQQAKAVLDMGQFNFAQLVYEAMLNAAEEFIREYKAMLFDIKNNEIIILKDKVSSLIKELNEEINNLKFELLEKKNPLFFYLINEDEISNFLQEFFYSKLSIDDLCNDVDFVRMDREDDTLQLLETHLIVTDGLGVLDKTVQEIRDIILSKYGNILEKPIEEAKEILYGGEDDQDAGFSVSDSSILKIEVETIKKKLFQVIHRRFQGFNFENISIKAILEKKKIPVQRLLEKLDSYSRPYIFLDANGLNSMEYYRNVSNFPINTYEDGDEVTEGAGNDLPSRMDHYRKRESAVPNISVETFEVPNLVKPYEIISIGMLLGFPIFKINSLEASAQDYHYLIAEKTHPLHCFNDSKYDAKYFPDPMRLTNYLNPAHLWKGLVKFDILVSSEQGYIFEDQLADQLREMEAREDYKKKVLQIDKKIEQAGGVKKVSMDIIGEAINSFAMLAKNPVTQKLQFRREYSIVIRDILDGDGTANRAREKQMTKDRYIEKYIENPEFANLGELSFFLENQYNVRDFLLINIKDIIEKSKNNIQAGAVISLPKNIWQEKQLPVFKDKYSFFDYYESRGSLEWQNLLKNRLVDKIDTYVSSARFRLESDPTLLDRRKVNEYLESIEEDLPQIVSWEIKVNNRIIK